MNTVNYRYDVAISFLAQDEALAANLHDQLGENLQTFVYSKRQEELAGTDGLESFRQVFLADARLVVVLYRDGWGKTKWTAVEELAIKERVFDGGWRSLLFVMLDEQSTPPKWLPDTHIRLNYARFGDTLVGAIKMRAQELGSELKVETAIEGAQRLAARKVVRQQREQMLSSQGGAAIHREESDLRKLLSEKLTEIEQQHPLGVHYGSDNNAFTLTTNRAGMNFHLYVTGPITDSRIVVQEFDGQLILPQQRASHGYFPGEQPQGIAKNEFYFDYLPPIGWSWRLKHASAKPLTTAELAEHLIKRLLKLDEEFETGKRIRRR